MPTKQVTIIGLMSWDDPGGPSQGPGFPTPPIYLPPGQPGFPSHPIAPGGTTPPWGINMPGHPSHPIYLPPTAGQGPGFPTHPIAPGGGPSFGPGFPTHPIAPGGTTPPWGINVPPIPGYGPGFPTPPMAPGGTTPPWGIHAPNLPSHPAIGQGAMVVWHPTYGWIIVPAGEQPPVTEPPPTAEPKPEAHSTTPKKTP